MQYRPHTLPSNEPVANKSGLRGHQSAWKVQLEEWDTSPSCSPVRGFQHKVLQSLPQDINKSES